MTDTTRGTNVQTFDWGVIRWTIEPNDLESQRLSVAEITFFPGKKQDMHSHYREEQVMHVLSGTGLHTVDGRTTRMRPGDSFALPPYTEHGISNESDKEELRLLLVYSPSRLQSLLQGNLGKTPFPPTLPDEPLTPVGTAGPPSLDDETDLGQRALFDEDTKDVILAAMERLSRALGLSLCMVDTDGRRIVRSQNHPTLCRLLADQTGGEHCSFHLKKVFRSLDGLTREELGKPHVFSCCHSIASTIFPVVIAGRVQAYIKCGEIFLGNEDKEALLADIPGTADAYCMDREALLRAAGAIPVEPKSRLYSAAEATFAMTSAVAVMAVSARRQKELDTSRLSLAQEQLATTRLEKSLREADLKLLQSQVAPHFLFNTLNTIALAAYAEGAKRATKLTWSLADLLRATLRKTEELIPLHEEINLVRCYIHIQKERFGDRIAFAIDADEDCMQALVPSLLFQPLVENAIVHGFGELNSTGSVSLSISRHGGGLCAVLEDDGAGFEPLGLGDGPRRIGLRSTQSRLEHYFGDAGSMDIRSSPGAGTRIVIVLPADEHQADSPQG
ncbi:histidine kinase [Desulfocurvus sp. DL9XJH121]